MAWLDSLLAIIVEQGADELRVASGEIPKMFAHGRQRPLSIPKMSDRDVRELLGGLLSGDHEAALKTEGRVTFTHDAGALGSFHSVLALTPNGPSATFQRTGSRAKPPAPPQPAQPPREVAVERPAPGVLAPATSPPASNSASIPTSELIALVAQAAQLRASDLHLSDEQPPVARVDGRLQRLSEIPVDVSRLFALGDDERQGLERGGSLDRGLDVPGVGRIRVHLYVAGGLVAAVRLLPRAAPSLSELGLPLSLDDLVALPHGLVLIVGPTGSGKSTTLAALAQEALRRRSIVLLTLEDPIEYSLAPTASSVVRRRQVERDVGSFAAGVRDALRADPDVLVIGELRDAETIALALTAAETGHLVLASLHGSGSQSAIERVVDAYPRERQQQIRTQLADSLRAIVGQRLVPRARKAGRVPVLEVLRVTTAVANLVREGKTAQIASVLQSSRREGMLAFERCLADRVRAGEITLEDARASANDVASLGQYLSD